MFSLSPAKWTRILVPIAAGLLLLAAACGDDDDGGGDDTSTPAATADATADATAADGIQTQPDSPQEVDAEVTEAVDGVLQTAVEDNFYTLNNLSVPLGETTTIEIVNDGTDIHNMRIAGPDGEFNTDDDSVSDPEQITAGSTATVDFTPTLAGTYTFQCDFHPAEQGGVIVVE
ncbi:MAG: cupredoxin domain-containing protein [Chloroflexi bacterium]|nr:cupredoxin domain-containing protein [Chloroflexota bacterium]MCI0817055.1 cupredoxin domain-containing protein [Chloroflexota bacterium]MCI0831728.1 cupredoxin domain-containing protein [Chloroflexota bacterium]MCI0839287.1 cupredoxin domain-containing protein [Chloroflexota bacterium]MCI0884707.1 cupredoxin domain-containing protein [Chloroflexota bacterium]